ncbi:MAG: S-layer homology domain-containing protein, partial [Clostridia bacterium]|nr:S-layer homology domain-containing protein [Clostridia bacterium]
FIRGNVYNTKQNTYFGYDSYEYGPKYEKDWYPDNSAFYGINCHQFIVAHLGYRLVLRESRLTAAPKAGGTLTLKGKIENTGFGNIFTEPTTQILLVGEGYSYVCDTAIKAETFQSCTVQDYSTTLSLPASMPAGEYKVYMRMTASTQTDFLSVKSAIQFANVDGIFNAEFGGNLIGTIDVEAGEATASAANDVFCEIGAGAVPDGRVTAGAPLLSGYGMTTADEPLELNYHTGDTLTLSAWNMLRSDASATYKWYRGTTLVGSEATLVKENITASDAGEYKLTVTSGGKTKSTMKVSVTVDEHKFGDYTPVKAAGCHTVGSEKRTCTHCSLTETRIIPTTAHTEGSPKKVLSTCTVRGTVTVSCTKCSDVLDFEILDLEPHDCETIIEEPTCLREGKKTLACVVCDYEAPETIPALGHNYIYVIDGDKATGSCSRCMEKTEEVTFDGFSDGYADTDDFDNDLGAISVNKSPVTFIGEGGYLTEYDAQGAAYVTLLFRAEGVETPIKLGKFRTTAYAADDKKNLGDSNNAGNYYGDLLFQVDGDGVYALTLRKYLMLPYGNRGWGIIKSAAFNDPKMDEKGKETVNDNKNATVEFLGIYNEYVSYHLLFTDADGNVTESVEGTYNPNVTWSNKICAVNTVASLYTGDTPTKRATADKVYTFSHWANAEGEEMELAIGKHIMTPVFTESENTCPHASVEKGVILAPTCNDDGKGSDVCADCGASVGEEYVIERTGHLRETESVKALATFKVEGEMNVHCADCREFLRTETIPKVKNPFGDVDVNGWYSDAVAYAYTNSIFGGTSATTFAPGSSMTRAMFVTVLGRMSGVPEDKDAQTAFTDVKSGQYYTGYVAWANKNGIVNGRTENTFAPDALITREEMCVMLVRYCEYELITLRTNPIVDSFADVTKFAKWSINQIETCRRSGLVGGKAVNENGGALFVPKGNATRAEVATILYNLKRKHID